MNRTVGGHRYFDIINSYYDGCNTANAEKIEACLSDDVVHYFVDTNAIFGANSLSKFFCWFTPSRDAHWTVDHGLISEPQAVIEWSMRWIPKQTGKPEIMRGSEWYIFQDDLISEIRSYHVNYYVNDPANRELRDFDYTDRGYTVL